LREAKKMTNQKCVFCGNPKAYGLRLFDLSKLVQKMEKLTKEAAGAAPDLRSIDP